VGSQNRPFIINNIVGSSFVSRFFGTPSPGILTPAALCFPTAGRREAVRPARKLWLNIGRVSATRPDAVRSPSSPCAPTQRLEELQSSWWIGIIPRATVMIDVLNEYHTVSRKSTTIDVVSFHLQPGFLTRYLDTPQERQANAAHEVLNPPDNAIFTVQEGQRTR
jgi:hypothetical protein